jgi:uncharacterized protein DUF6527
MTADVLTRITDGNVVFWCPGCNELHMVWVESPNDLTGAKWGWNKSMDRPTFTPSILVRGTEPITHEEADRILAGEKIEKPKTVCHSFVRDGAIEFLGDCTHILKGQTVPLAPIP